MAKVPNWQLGREMSYPYEKPAAAGKQFSAVFNINRCIACQTCTMACKSTWTFSQGQEFMWWNNVESKPYGGYPQHWDMKTLALLEEADPGGQKWDAGKKDPANAPYGVYNGLTVFEAAEQLKTGQTAIGYIPTDAEWSVPNIHEDTSTVFSAQGGQIPEHQTWFFYLQRICNHCSYPACLASCPRKAIYKREEDGIVLVDQSRCRGYRKCVEACPYKKVMYRGNTRVAEKCIACYPRVEGTDPLTEGEPMVTRCISVCVGKIRLQGWVNDEKSPINFLVHKERVALPLYPQFGTQPNVYYIPPRWVPRQYLRQMFGPGVDEAIAKYANPSHELLGVLQLFGATQKLIASYEITADEAIGFNAGGREIVRVPIVEPVIVRPPERLNIT